MLHKIKENQEILCNTKNTYILQPSHTAYKLTMFKHTLLHM